MQKYTAKNLTNRTLQMHLPGGRYMRLAPGSTCSLNQLDCKLPMVKKMMRKNALIIPNLTPSGAPRDQSEKPREKSDEKKTSAKSQQPSKDQQLVNAGPEAAADAEAGSESVVDRQPESAESMAADLAAEQEQGAEPSQRNSTHKKEQTVKKTSGSKKS